MGEFRLSKGTLCLIEEKTKCRNTKTGEQDWLFDGIPVKIVDVSEPPCAAKSSIKCQTSNEERGCSYAVMIEDAYGNYLTVNCIETEDGETFPFVPMNKEKTKFLLSEKGWQQYKLSKLSDDGFSVKCHGPFAMLIALAMCVLTPKLSLLSGLQWATLIAGGLLGLWGTVIFIAGLIYNRNPLSHAERRFFSLYPATKEELEFLLKQSQLPY